MTPLDSPDLTNRAQPAPISGEMLLFEKFAGGLLRSQQTFRWCHQPPAHTSQSDGFETNKVSSHPELHVKGSGEVKTKISLEK